MFWVGNHVLRRAVFEYFSFPRIRNVLKWGLWRLCSSFWQENLSSQRPQWDSEGSKDIFEKDIFLSFLDFCMVTFLHFYKYSHCHGDTDTVSLIPLCYSVVNCLHYNGLGRANEGTVVPLNVFCSTW